MPRKKLARKIVLGFKRSKKRVMRRKKTVLQEPIPPGKVFRYKRSTALIRQFRRSQKRDDLLLPKSPFAKVFKDASEQYKPGLRWQRDALDALQDAAELHPTTVFSAAQLQAIRLRTTAIHVENMQLATAILKKLCPQITGGVGEFYNEKSSAQPACDKYANIGGDDDESGGNGDASGRTGLNAEQN